MNEARQLFQDIRNIFKTEGVDVEVPTVENKEVTENPETVVTEEKETEVTETPKTEKFEDVVLEDGTVAQIEPDVTLGAAMVVMVEDELLPAPDGDWALADGRVVTTEGGVIVAITEPELEEDEAVPSEDEELKNEPLTENQKKEAKKIIESIVTEKHFGKAEDIDGLKKEIIQLKTAFTSLLELTEKLVNQPTTNSVKKQKSGFQNLKKDKKADIIERLKAKNIIN